MKRAQEKCGSLTQTLYKQLFSTTKKTVALYTDEAMAEIKKLQLQSQAIEHKSILANALRAKNIEAEISMALGIINGYSIRAEKPETGQWISIHVIENSIIWTVVSRLGLHVEYGGTHDYDLEHIINIFMSWGA